MAPVMGPVLGFRGQDGNNWNVSALFVLKDDDAGQQLEWALDGSGQSSIAGDLLKTFEGKTVVCYEISVPLGTDEQTATYALDGSPGTVWRFVTPAIGNTPRMAYASCNGFSDPKYIKQVDDKNALWTELSKVHAGDNGPFHLMLLGGDQVYADQIWEAVPSIKEWIEIKRDDRVGLPFNDDMRDEVEAFYFNLYCERWNQKEVKKAFASIPTVMMWDDHDIFDGWGSYPIDLQTCEVYKGIFKHARDHFAIFQQHIDSGDAHPAALPGQSGFTLGYKVGGVAILALDMRSERTMDQVLGTDTWNALVNWVSGTTGGDSQHLLVMSSIPVAHPDLSWGESVLGWIPGQQELEDDLRDHWNSPAHKGERLRLVHRLFKTAHDNRIRITLLSGDVHVAALGAIETRRYDNLASIPLNSDVINQLTSSAIVHPAPPGIMNIFYELLGRGEQEVDRGITIKMLKFPGANERFITARNWLSLIPDEGEGGRLWANFHIEKEPRPYTKVIHPVI
jgi:hypothetical protein